MATVPFSTKLRTDILASATSRFTQVKTEAVRAVQFDDELLRTLLEEETGSKALVDAAFVLYAQDMRWFDKYYASTSVKCGGINLNIDTSARPQLAHQLNSATYDLESDKFPRSNKRFHQLMAPYYRAEADCVALTATLNKIMDECQNVNNAIKVMPSILDWCSADIRMRLQKANAKPTAKRTADEIRADAFNEDSMAALARSRLL